MILSTVYHLILYIFKLDRFQVFKPQNVAKELTNRKIYCRPLNGGHLKIFRKNSSSLYDYTQFFI